MRTIARRLIAVLAMVPVASACTTTAGSPSVAPSTVTTIVTTTALADSETTTTTMTVTTTEQRVVAASRLPAEKTFDNVKVAAGVTKILTDPTPRGYGLTGVSNVTCPAAQRVAPNATFTCRAMIKGSAKSILITVKDESGKYEVGVPQ